MTRILILPRFRFSFQSIPRILVFGGMGVLITVFSICRSFIRLASGFLFTFPRRPPRISLHRLKRGSMMRLGGFPILLLVKRRRRPLSLRSLRLTMPGFLFPMFSEGKAFLTLLGKGGEPLATVPCSSANAKACFRACEKRGLVANIDSKKGEAFLKGESK